MVLSSPWRWVPRPTAWSWYCSPPSHSPLPHSIPCKGLSNHYPCSCFRLNPGSHQRPCSLALDSTHLFQPILCASPWVSLKKVKAALQQCKSAVITHISSDSWASLPGSHPTPLGHHRAPDWAPWVTEQLLTSYLFYARVETNTTL